MAVTSQGYVPKDITISNASDALITNLQITTANVEQSHSLQTTLKQLIIRNRDNGTTKISFEATESGTKYLTIRPASVLALDNITFSGKTLYLQSDKISTVEIVELFS